LLRRTLAGQPDHSVVVIQVGFSTNLARLLNSKADRFSRLAGRELVQRKVKLLSVMAGQYADSTSEGLRRSKASPEFNIFFDVNSARELFARWPTPVVASGFEVGASMLFKGAEIQKHLAYAPRDPVAVVYRYTDPIYRYISARAGELHDHPTFDLTSVLYAVRPEDGYFSLSAPGTISVRPDGSAKFTGSPSGSHRYLLMTDEQRARALEAMTLLATEPPTLGQ
jgi:inosine-uridine nucleoside N-ribohydrolase